ncbi:DUF3037 domain-containing protein [Beggiatoa leptomitoformis]|uniref:DUF3037 domain-containing protein n=1 Tax=Beggiatoa leptomitoformis TaxID=288004 RepID=A0A2N9Y9U8_9GAMM|nr:DUF3037 domain-containing protein [Beggiatoa leptomitoformis]AUI67229.1 DUF3037 domain-containing protein [Beggiatoa leptomitoformis]QGX03594.1 DUF3037 domain-containing protein [Beggiatoa leptomitoformis]
MEKILCQYAIVRFMPTIETEEFINVGIVLLATQHHFFGFKLTNKRYGRITHFFHKEARDAYLFAKENILEKELIRIQKLLDKYQLENHSKKEYSDFARTIFNELIRPRETAIRFSEQKVLLSNNVENTLEDLFASYVNRYFVSKPIAKRISEK